MDIDNSVGIDWERGVCGAEEGKGENGTTVIE